MKFELPELLKSELSDYTQEYRRYLLDYFNIDDGYHPFTEDTIIRSGEYMNPKPIFVPMVCCFVGKGSIEPEKEFDLSQEVQVIDETFVDMVPENCVAKTISVIQWPIPLAFKDPVERVASNFKYGVNKPMIIDGKVNDIFYSKAVKVEKATKVENGRTQHLWNMSFELTADEIYALPIDGADCQEVNHDKTINEICLAFFTPEKRTSTMVVNGNVRHSVDFVKCVPFFRFAFKDVHADMLRDKPLKFFLTFEE